MIYLNHGATFILDDLVIGTLRCSIPSTLPHTIQSTATYIPDGVFVNIGVGLVGIPEWRNRSVEMSASDGRDAICIATLVILDQFFIFALKPLGSNKTDWTKHILLLFEIEHELFSLQPCVVKWLSISYTIYLNNFLSYKYRLMVWQSLITLLHSSLCNSNLS